MLGGVEDHIAGEPLGLVLGVEPPEGLNLGEVGEALEEPALGPLHGPVPLVSRQGGAQGGEVEAQSLVALVPEMLDGRAQSEVDQAVRVVARVTSHEVEGVPADARGRHELAHGRSRPIRPTDHGEQEAGVPRIEHPAEHHGKAPLVLALAAHAHEGGQLLGKGGVEMGRVVEGRGVAVFLYPVEGLPESFHFASGEGEGLYLHHRLVAQVDVVHPRVSVDGEPLLACSHDRCDPPVVVGEAPERTPDLLALVAGPDGVGRDEADAAIDGIGHQAVPVEEPLLVGPEGEVVEGGGAVATDDVPRPELGRPTRGEAPVDHRPGEQEQGHGHER